jgi:DNA-binding XRE family transcriptional regulator
MDRSPGDIAFDLGRRLRDARIHCGLTQEQVGRASGLSTSTVSRMELGHGAAVSLAAWVTVADVVGAAVIETSRGGADMHLDAVSRLMAIGGWVLAGRTTADAWFDRPVRPNTTFRHVQLPAERAVVRIVRTVTDLDVERDRLLATTQDLRAAAPGGLAMAGLLVIPRSTNNRRRSRSYQRLSTSGWILALRSSEARMPLRPGVVWLAPRGTHWLPVG